MDIGQISGTAPDPNTIALIRAEFVRRIDAAAIRAQRNCDEHYPEWVAEVGTWLACHGCTDAPCMGEQHFNIPLSFWRRLNACSGDVQETVAKAERRIFNARNPWIGEPVLDLPKRLDRIAAGRRALMAGAVA